MPLVARIFCDMMTAMQRLSAMTTRQIGERGESIARRYLRRQGCEILACNWACQYGEIDIIMRQAGVIAFVEVKARHAPDTDDILSGITPQKRERIVKAAQQYLHNHGLDEALWRIDAVAVALRQGKAPLVEHVIDVFDW